MNDIAYRPIGVIHSPFKEPKGAPIQPKGARDVKGKVRVFPKFSQGIKDLEGFSHIILVYHFHLSRKSSLRVIPYMDEKPRGVFATRAPCRPNPIGISVVHLDKIDRETLYVRGLDIVDGTPLLDIKPYVPEFDLKDVAKIGWLEKNIHKLSQTEDDGRFIEEQS